MTIGTRKSTYHYEHVSTNLGNVTVKIGDEEYLAQLAIRPSTVTIYNTTVNTDNWTAVASSLSGILSWKLKDKEGQEFDYAFVAVPTTYMTSLGEALQRETDITAVYVKRRSTVTLNMQLECWSA